VVGVRRRGVVERVIWKELPKSDVMHYSQREAEA
jgi:hypothetical protein